MVLAKTPDPRVPHSAARVYPGTGYLAPVYRVNSCCGIWGVEVPARFPGSAAVLPYRVLVLVHFGEVACEMCAHG